MVNKGSKLYSVLFFKCPACHEGDFFVSHPYDLTKAGDIYKSCSVCQTKFSKEPGFYYGAMYVSYAIAVGLSLSIYLLFNVFNYDISVELFLLVYSVFILLSSPLIYALSKIIWANIFIKFHKK
ncbi:MAG: DUF983 domain-containing protein [Flavobacteriales bacterium]|jgi:uncharacterized protein (DUF983 family)|tara:strand:- start:790 stop:1161 length:372 start_codon:yes stop_codon:yes gene_type:complete